MKIMVIIVKERNDDTPFILEAWDEWTWEDNPDYFNKKAQEARKKYHDSRVATVEVSDDFLKRAFRPYNEKGTEKGPGKREADLAEALKELVDMGGVHEKSDCSFDDTCTCEIAKKVNDSIAAHEAAVKEGS